MRFGWRRTVGVAALAMVLAAAGCGGDDDDGGGGESAATPAGSGEPIKLGGLFTLSPIPFGNDAQKMMNTVFDDVNAQGGIDGRKIEYLSGDDTGTPQKAAQLARQYVGDGAVAMVGHVSFVDCGTNQGYYQEQDILSISAIGADPFCFTTPNIAPVNIGPFTSITADLYYASETLGDEKICIFMAATPGTKEAQAAAVERWTEITGKKPHIFDAGLPLNETNFTPYLLRAKNAGCDAIFRNGADTVGQSVLKTAKNQGMEDVDFLFDASSYSAQLAKSAGSLGMKVYLASEFEPFTEESEANAGWREAAAKGGVRETAFSQGAYVAAQWIVDVLKSIDGEITRESVTAKLREGEPFEQPMAGSPLVFGDGKAHAPNQAFKIVSIAKDGTWKVETDEFITLPESG